MECILKKFNSDNSVVAVLSADSSGGIDNLGNFMSSVFRLNLKVVLGSGRLARRRLFVKVAEDCHEALTEIQSEYEVFKIETLVS